MFGLKEVTEKLEKANHLIGELKEENKRLKEAESKIKEEFATKEKTVVAMMEIEKKEAILSEKDRLQTEYNKKLNSELQNNFDKLSKSLTSLHEEGNATTKYVQALSMKVIDKMTPNNSTPLLSENSEE